MSARLFVSTAFWPSKCGPIAAHPYVDRPPSLIHSGSIWNPNKILNAVPPCPLSRCSTVPSVRFSWRQKKTSYLWANYILTFISSPKNCDSNDQCSNHNGFGNKRPPNGVANFGARNLAIFSQSKKKKTWVFQPVVWSRSYCKQGVFADPGWPFALVIERQCFDVVAILFEDATSRTSGTCSRSTYACPHANMGWFTSNSDQPVSALRLHGIQSAWTPTTLLHWAKLSAAIEATSSS